MVISVVMLGGILLSAAAIAGLLMVYQIRSSNDVVNSAKAVFAADAGIEIATWCIYKVGNCPNNFTSRSSLPVNFSDPGVSFEVDLNLTPTDITITSRGFSAGGRIVRMLETVFEAEAAP